MQHNETVVKVLAGLQGAEPKPELLQVLKQLVASGAKPPVGSAEEAEKIALKQQELLVLCLIQYAFGLRRQVMQDDQSADIVQQAGHERLRPILMTSGATVAGHFPLVLVSGAGAAARNAIGLVIVGGLTTSTFLTLMIIPTIYSLVDDAAGFVRRVARAL